MQVKVFLSNSIRKTSAIKQYFNSDQKPNVQHIGAIVKLVRFEYQVTLPLSTWFLAPLI